MLRILLIIAALVGCGGKKDGAIAELKQASGPVERQEGTGAWAAVKLGQLFYLGDAARTADQPAELRIVGNGAKIAMQPHTVLRFGGTRGASKIAVELGAIELSGDGVVGLAVGDVRLRQGRVRVTSKGQGAELTLEMGDASVSSLDGQTFDLVVGSVVDLGMDDVTVTSVRDAGVVDAPPADVPATPDVATLALTGKVEQQLPGQTAWQPATAGALVAGSKLRVGKGGTAKVTAKGSVLDLAGGAAMTLGSDLSLSLDAGDAVATGPGTIKLPGGALALTAEAAAKLDVSPRDTRVTQTRGGASLTGTTGGEKNLSRGESATLARNGTIRVIEAIPTYYDFQVDAGETAIIHDPRGNTAVRFAFGGRCKDGGFVEMDQNARFQTAKVSAGKDSANLMASSGRWAYRLRCSTGRSDSAPVASGRITILRDDGGRPLPKAAATNAIDADGRTWRISYQSVIPTMRVTTKGAGTFKLHIATGGKEQVFTGKGGKIDVPGSKLDEGTYTYYLERDGVKDPKISTLIIDFDNTAPQVYIQSPAATNAKPWEPQIQVRGAVLPGWTAAVGGVEIPVDKQRRFAGKVDKPTATTTLAIRLSHPQRGVHYYLRRAK